ncbi:hypothetical protein [Pseudoduganella namucuonensis]|uniref:Holin n=1 Tax=Pseudoduganella namucuonensis TaxID=1035707 RepID=A0A1I7M7H2_9BURK|nr:hypothetical protein [Pseudoduganella namucuonensis]SFV17884.1 hypothetical protein SAMN05216552_10806 [Pseudoduganella namucuonensis]
MNILKRLKEPSTQAGLSSLATLAVLFGVPVTLTQAILQGIGALTALAAIVIPEATTPPAGDEVL